MIKNLTKIGNSKAVIIPAKMIKKYQLNKILIEEKEEGILIRSAQELDSFHNAINKLRKNKAALYKRIESQANDPETIKYYNQEENNVADVDLDLMEDPMPG
ncbi:MAG: AbrB/MazE/SpoVT family DNA-binding domain-containing protein [Saprospiraceae bacterium]|nr:AbrB/MazE/SpoVT family DNA-binding domain-containing protein [Saprospiraceae bacterium]